MRIAYTIAQKAEAIALAAVIGAEAAADQLGMDRKTIVKWSLLAGHRPELEVDGWQKLHDLAVAKTTAAVASGSLPVRTVAVIAGIAARNLRPSKVAAVEPVDPDDPEPLTTAALAQWNAWVDSLPQSEHRAVTHTIRTELLRRHEVGMAAVRAGDDVPEPAGDQSDEAGAAMWLGLLEWSRANLPDLIVHAAAADALETARTRQREIAGRWLYDDEADLLIQAEQALLELEEIA